VLFVLPIVVVCGAVVIAHVSRDDGSLRLASGATGGTFHPIAGSFRPDGRVLGECGEDYSCIQQAFGNIAYRQGVERALSLFERELGRSTSVKQDCHRVVHMIGAAALERFRGDVARTLAAGSATCGSGYYHGVLERAFVGVETRAGLVDVARGLCVADTIRPQGFLDYQCRHGLGHGLMIQGGYDLPLALETCERLQTGWDAVACYGGAFMENATTLWGYRSPWLDEKDPLSPCEEIAERHRRWCYLRAPTRIVASERQDVRAVAGTCATLPADYAEPCLRGLGREVANMSDYAPKRIVELCGRVGVGTDLCFYGAARTIGERAALSGPRSAARMCARAPTSRRDACFGGVGIAVGLRYPTNVARRRACATLAGTSADACSEKAIAAVDATGRAAWG
jgi:hypothetical protein